MPCRVPAAAVDVDPPPVNRVDFTSPMGLRSLRCTLRPPATDDDSIAVRGEVESTAGRGGSTAGSDLAGNTGE